MSYTEAIYDGTIEDNYNYLVTEKPHKSRFINYHLPKLKEYAEKCEHITEFGVDGVNSTWALLAGKPKTMVSVDPNNFKAPKILELVKELTKKENINFEFIQNHSTNLEEIDETDLLFIDSGHTYECMSQEFKMHSHKVKKYMVLHDMEMPELQSAVFDVLNVTKNENSLMQKLLSDSHSPEWKIVYTTDKSEGLWILERVGDK